VVAALVSMVYAGSMVVGCDVSLPLRLCGMDVDCGIATFAWGQTGPPPAPQGPPRARFYVHRPYLRVLPPPEFWTATPSRSVTWIYVLRLPMWAVWLPVIGAASWAWWRGRARFGAGVCQKCGYELAGLNGGACPECGNAIE
jgi:hypothetical protein